jgi:hypothetical protein
MGTMYGFGLHQPRLAAITFGLHSSIERYWQSQITPRNEGSEITASHEVTCCIDLLQGSSDRYPLIKRVRYFFSQPRDLLSPRSPTALPCPFRNHIRIDDVVRAFAKFGLYRLSPWPREKSSSR